MFVRVYELFLCIVAKFAMLQGKNKIQQRYVKLHKVESFEDVPAQNEFELLEFFTQFYSRYFEITCLFPFLNFSSPNMISPE